MTKTIIGVDISKDRFDAYRLPDRSAKPFDNTKTGIRAFLKWAGGDVDRVVFEPTGPYHRAFEGACAKAGLTLLKVNPKNARRFAEGIGVLAKTDRVDAAVLARMGQLDDLQSRPVADEKLNRLKELIAARRALVKERTRIKNRSKNLTVRLIKTQHQRRLDQIKRDMAKIDDAMRAIIKDNPVFNRRFEILVSIPGLAEQTAFAFLIDMPELGTMSGKEAAALAGLAPITRQSGQRRGRAMIGGGRKMVRDALYMPALVATRFNDDLKRKYDDLIATGKPAKLAITAIMRKIVVLANALIRDDRVWQPKRA